MLNIFLVYTYAPIQIIFMHHLSTVHQTRHASSDKRWTTQVKIGLTAKTNYPNRVTTVHLANVMISGKVIYVGTLYKVKYLFAQYVLFYCLEQPHNHRWVLAVQQVGRGHLCRPDCVRVVPDAVDQHGQRLQGRVVPARQYHDSQEASGRQLQHLI